METNCSSPMWFYVSVWITQRGKNFKYIPFKKLIQENAELQMNAQNEVNIEEKRKLKSEKRAEYLEWVAGY
jgi:hypothetical protein